MTTWPVLLNALVAGRDLSADETAWAMGEVMAGDATPSQVAGFAMALRAKGETSDEVAGLVRAMLERAPLVRVEGLAVDTCGSGGDGAHTVNISTMAAVVVAAAGVPVVKHGNRAASSACGAADLLEALGVRIGLSPEAVSACVAEVGVGFCFAPVFHAGMRHAAVPRRELGIATFFNFLGPLTNPARVRAQAVGISDARMAPVVAGVLATRGSQALVFRGDDGLDELTVTTTSTVWEVRDGAVRPDTLDPRSLGLPTAQPDSLRGGDAARNADVARQLVAGQTGPVRDAVLLNAAAALVAAADDHTGPLEARLSQQLQRAATAVDSGAAAALLDRWVATSQRLGGEPSALEAQ